MIKYLLLVLCILFFLGDSSAQENQKYYFFPYSLQLETLNSSGFLGTLESSASDILSGNPANSGTFSKLSFGLSFQATKPFQYPFAISDETKVSRKSDIIPQSFGIVYPLNEKWSFAAGFNQVYSGLYETSIPVVTIEQPEGTGERITASNETRLFKYSVSAAYKFNNLLFETDKLTVSGQIDLFHLKETDLIWHTKASYQKLVPTLSVGINYQLNDNWQFGLFVTPKVKIEGSFKIEHGELLIRHDLDSSNIGNNSEIPVNFYGPFPYQYDYPAFLSGGLSYNSKTFWKIKYEIAKRFWNTIDANQTDDLIISGTFIFNLSDNFSFSTGYYASDHSVDLKYFGSAQYTRSYLLFGLKYKIDNFTFDAAVADNQSLEDKSRITTTIYKLSLNYEL